MSPAGHSQTVHPDTIRSPDHVQEPRAGALNPARPDPASTTNPTNVAGRRGWEGELDFDQISKDLRSRGVNAGLRSLLQTCSLKAIARTIAWWDGEQAKTNAPGPGLLVDAIRRGGVAEPRKSLIDQNIDYCDEVCGWLNATFPELRDSHGWPHPAAITAVFRLHHAEQTHALSREGHGSKIQAAVKAWEKRYGKGMDC